MKKTAIAAIVLAAGQGVRMRSALPKVLHPVGGRSMLAHAIDAVSALSPQKLVVVVSDQGQEIGDTAKALKANAEIAVQSPPRGTADAVAKAMPLIEGFEGTALVIYADTPLIEPETLMALRDTLATGASAAVLGFRSTNPGGYGRLKLDGHGALTAIIEAKDASREELQIDLCNSGVMAIEVDFLRQALPQIDANNAKGEYYLTDIIALAVQAGRTCAVIERDEEEVLGVNSRSELALAEAIFQNRMRRKAMAAGVTLLDPSTVYFSFDTEIGEDVTIGQHVVLNPGVKIASGTEIRAFSHIEGATIGSNAIVGPFARLRPGTDIAPDARVGNFVEIKKAVIGEGAKINHLTYIGDAQIGARANIGAGTITCNYDGFNKHTTVIGDDAFIGSNTALVAPVTVARGAYIGSGSVITKNVDEDALAVARSRQSLIKGWAVRFRQSNKANQTNKTKKST